MMKTFGRYLAYRLEKSALRSLVITLISVALVQNVISDSIRYTTVDTRDTGLYMFAVLMGTLCTLIPMLETACFKNRRNLDTLYFFPIKREKLALAHYLSGLIQVVMIYTFVFFFGYTYLVLKTNCFALEYMIPYYFLSLLVGLVIYSVIIFLFGQANTVADGVIICGLWVFVLYLVAWQLRGQILDNWLRQDHDLWLESSGLPEWGILYTPLNHLTVIFQDLIEVNQHTQSYDYTHNTAMQIREQLYMFAVWGVIGLGAAFGYFFTFVRKGAEKAGEISNSWFGYKLLIPMYAYSLLLFYDSLDFMTILVFVAMVIGYVIYRRGFKLKLSDLVCMGCGISVFILGNLI